MTTTTISSAAFAALFGIGDLRSPANRMAYAALNTTIANAHIDNAAFDAAQAEAEEMALLPRSVVPTRYKRLYKDLAAKRGATTKAAARCNGDWLARKLESLVLKTAIVEGEQRQVLDVEAFEAILDANGIEQWRNWSRDSNGWQGRFRMNGSQMLRSRIAKAGAFHLPDGSQIEPPVSFIDAHI